MTQPPPLEIQLTRKPVTPRLQGSRPFWSAMQAYPRASALAVALEEFGPVLFTPVGLEGVCAELLHALVELFLLALVIADAFYVEGAGRQGESDRKDDGDRFEGSIHYAASRMRRTLPILISRFSDQLTRKPVTPRLHNLFQIADLAQVVSLWIKGSAVAVDHLSHPPIFVWFSGLIIRILLGVWIG